MTSSGVIIWSMCMILIIGIFLSFIYIVVPINLKLQFNDICSDFNYKALIQGGLTQEEIENLKNRLKDKGFLDIDIKITSSKDISFSKPIEFVVKCKVNYIITAGIFKYKITEGNLKYEKYSFSKTLSN